MVVWLPLELWEALAIDIPAVAVSIVIFLTWVYPKLRRLEYWKFIEGWMAFLVVVGVSGLVIEVGVVDISMVTALVNFIVAMVVALAMAPVVFRAVAQMNARRGVSLKSG